MKKISIDDVVMKVMEGETKLPVVETVDFTPCMDGVKFLADSYEVINAVQRIFKFEPDYTNAILRMVYMTGGEVGFFAFLDIIYQHPGFSTKFTVSGGRIDISDIAWEKEVEYPSDHIDLPWMTPRFFPEAFGIAQCFSRIFPDGFSVMYDENDRAVAIVMC